MKDRLWRVTTTTKHTSLLVAGIGLVAAAGCFGNTGTIGDLPDAGETFDSGPPYVGSEDASADSTVAPDEGAPPPQAEAGPDAREDSAVHVDSGSDASVGADAPNDTGPTVDATPDAAAPDAVADGTADGGADGGGADGGDDGATDGSVDAGQQDTGADSGLPILTVSGGGNKQITLANGVTLYVSDAHTTWSFGGVSSVTYQNLPPELIGTIGNDTVNNSSLVSFTLTGPTTCYLLRQVNWSAVDLTGWTQFATASYYFDGYNNGAYGTAIIYSKTLGPGTYDLSTFSAMYSCAAQ
jgi:hypothetical protein